MPRWIAPAVLAVVRFTGDAAAVRETVGRAVFVRDAWADAGGDGTGWHETMRGLVGQSEQPPHVVVLPESDEALAWALPGAYLAVYAGSPVDFVGREALSSNAAVQLRELDLPLTSLRRRR